MENDRFILNRNSDVKVIYIGTGQFQLASGKWVDAILYKYNGVYKMMEASEFIRLAEQDKSTTLDRIGDIIGTGYTPNIDPDKEEHNLPETEKYFQRWTKVIIDNSRGLRLGFFYFFLFLNCYVCIKTRNKIFYICTETRNSNNCLPRLEFRI